MHGSAADTILKITDVTKSFGQVAALKGMRLQVRRGRVHTLLGENGAGKSTLMKILAGVHGATSGEIVLDGQAYRPANPQEAASLGLAIVFQELSLCNNLTVAENILATREPRRFGFINDKALVAKAHRIVADLRLPIDVTEKVGNLSIAQRQLVEIAKGLSHDAKVVILDEPTSSLSDSEAEILFEIIGRLRQRGAAIIYISHRMEEIMRLSDDITVIRDGEYVSTHARDEVTIETLIALMVGRRMDEIYPPPVHHVAADRAPVLAVDRLTREGEFQDVSFDVRAGEILGFFGLVGSGRSEVMNALFGMKSAAGTVRLDGEVVRFRSPDQAIARGVGFVTENRKEEGLVLGHSVEWNISMAALADFAGGLGFIRNGAERAAASEQVGKLSIKTNSLETPAGALSGGNQQKIVLAKWLLTRPKVLILDEPTRGVDVGAKFEIYKIIRQLAAEGTAILLISSDLPEVLGMSDRVVVMHEGAPGATLEGSALTPETIMAHATGFQS
ncbi:sugar ABC transporter ATP-binding protein [Sinorhizobium meliloti]|uniref:sugar ABC transporter ATP-binding protein n=1 Tax=Rhizobium meliloti TaxID=382 RepID=UPI0002D25D84|nr:sugar ABC transporter ATP-binding protein [Sinorhizobium meliloti]ASJ63258.1 D-xylose ABC transporter ATP-binding protein [Sinorhizobium meliloti]MCK3787020.1 sugar ABC transporter ATP-binding protein [Sinorhizobium meliloti]MCK3793304.1 sugar ABC transporter ATP-binding protein [Sinorhizobium meliloti]MCK3798815.1 sugar ABC transporter ATP-binding protein [Sinorhizobium meliloti]MDE3760751.1 sugar ABC transporter ATP-binding protein [Sinorhizobium meliloti]